MEKISIVPELINSNEITIVDINNMPVIICQKSRFRFNYKFQMPYILVDNFEKEKYKEVDIAKIDITKLDKLGFRVTSIKTYYKIRNYQNQKKSYMIERKNKPFINSTIMTRMPADHYLEIDLIGNRIRMTGKNCYPYRKTENASPWLLVGEEYD